MKKRLFTRILSIALVVSILSSDIFVNAASEITANVDEAKTEAISENENPKQTPESITEETLEEEIVEKENNPAEEKPSVTEESAVYTPYWEEVTFSNLVVFVDFADTQREHIYNADTLEIFNGDTDHPHGMRQYLYDISYGEMKLENIFPQYDEEADQVTTFVLDKTAKYYAENENALICEVAELLNDSELLTDNIPLNYGNEKSLVNHLTVVVPCEEEGSNSLFKTHTDQYVGEEGIGEELVFDYSVLTESDLCFTEKPHEVLIQNALETLGYKNLENLGAAEYPLADFRATQMGWFEIPVVTENQVGYTMTDVSGTTEETKNQQAVILKTDISDTEYFVIEYRKELSEEEGASDLLIYRVDTEALYAEKGESSRIKVFEPEERLVYSDGSDSGISFENVIVNDNDTITFGILFEENQEEQPENLETELPEKDLQEELPETAQEETSKESEADSQLLMDDSEMEEEVLETKEDIRTSLQTADGKCYIYNDQGELLTGYFEYNGQKYYADNNGVLKSGWIKVGDIWRYFDKNKLYCEIEADSSDGYWYYLSDGRISYFEKKTKLVQNSWKTIGEYRYHFNSEGFVNTGLFQDGRYCYYAETKETATDKSPVGNVVKGVRRIGDRVFGFHPSKYYRLSGWQTVGKERYFFQNDCSEITGCSAVTDWYQEGNDWYYAEPIAETEELQISPEGAMATGEKRIGGQTYYFDSKYHLTTGWMKINNEWRYFETADTPEDSYEIGYEKKDGWVILSDGSGRKSYINTKNSLIKGWQTIDGKRYYFDQDGFLKTGCWFTVSKNKYYANADGVVAQGIREIDETFYMFHQKSYYVLKGWQTLNGKKYYVNEGGSIHTGWYHDGKYTYYGEPLDAEDDLSLVGSMAKGDKTITDIVNGEEVHRIYYFDSKYHLQTGWLKINNKWRYFDQADTPKASYEINYTENDGWVTLTDGSGRKSYINTKNSLLKGWQTIEGKKYYFNSSGILETGWFTVGSSKYYADENGILQYGGASLKGWQTIEGKDYYFNSKGQVTKGFKTIDGKKCYFDSNGAMKTGWFQDGKYYYYAKSDVIDGDTYGIVVTGLVNLPYGEGDEIHTYYFDKNSRLLTGWQTINGRKYFFETADRPEECFATCENIPVSPGWMEQNGNRYYVDSKGRILTGWQTINKQRFYFDKNGVLQSGWFTVGKNTYYGEPETKADGTLIGTVAKGVREIVVNEETGETQTYVFHSSQYYRLTGFQTVSGKRYYLDPENEGRARYGWFEVKGKHYYGEPETKSDGTVKGALAKGVREIVVDKVTGEKRTYVFHSSQYYRLTGFQNSGGRRYYLQSDGVARTGWFMVGTDLYYGEESTEGGNIRGALAAGIKTMDGGETYFFHPKSNYRLTGWQTVDKKKYYFNSSGMMQTGWCTINGKDYFFNSEGVYMPMTAAGFKSVTSKKYETVEVEWNLIYGAESYILEYSKDSAFSSGATSSVSISDTATAKYSINHLENNERYYFRMKYTAVGGEEEAPDIAFSAYSSVKSVVVCGEIEPAADSAVISSCEIESGGRDTGIVIRFQASFGGQQIKSADDSYYIVETESYGNEIDYAEPVSVLEKNSEIDVTFKIGAGNGSEDVRQAVAVSLMNKFALAIKKEDGSFLLVSAPLGISNPEKISENKADIFKPTSKKGIQGVALEEQSNGSAVPRDWNAYGSNSKNTLFNIMIDDLVGTSAENGYEEYFYKGKIYYFSNCAAEMEVVRNLVKGYPGYMNPGEGHINQVAVTFVLLLRYDNDTAYLIDPAARSKGHSYYTLNVREEKSRETLEALFLYLGEKFGQDDCYVTHWVLGNEINSSRAWNYGGSLSFKSYMKCYTSAFRLFYNGIKAGKSGNNVYISLDNGWTAAPDTYSGKSTLDKFADYAQVENPDMKWSIAYHGYSYPLTRNDFWNDNSNTTSSGSTRYISMKNIKVLTNYAASLEEKYEKEPGSIRVILSEQGFNGSNPKSQAQALARAYYAAEFNDRIDAFIIRAIIDDPAETRGGLKLGLRDQQAVKRISYFVYEFMDSDLDKFSQLNPADEVSQGNMSKFVEAQRILCQTNWKSIYPEFDKEKLAKVF